MKKSAIKTINENFIRIRRCIPAEFARKQRTCNELEHWKATEFRLLLMYTGIAAFNGVLEKQYYDHFLLLVSSIRILSHPKDCIHNNDCTAEMLTEFVEKFSVLYGQQYVSYNVHSLLHLATDVKEYGHLNNYSAFKFENFMQQLKKMIKKGQFPIKQIINRLNEKEHYLTAEKSSQYVKQFSLSTVPPNNYCIFENRIIKIIEIKRNSLKGVVLSNCETLFDYPTNSFNIGIYTSNNIESFSDCTQEFQLKDVTKLVKLELLYKNYYIEQLHI